MLAAQSIGAVPVPIYQDSVGEELAYVLDHCNARFLVAGDQEQVDKVLDIKDNLKSLTADYISRCTRHEKIRPQQTFAIS